VHDIQYRILVGGCWYLLMGGIPNLDSRGRASQNLDDERQSDTVLLQPDHEPPNYHTYVSYGMKGFCYLKRMLRDLQSLN
jgi:hypothetical protein